MVSHYTKPWKITDKPIDGFKHAKTTWMFACPRLDVGRWDKDSYAAAET
jgi:hypothetical protein